METYSTLKMLNNIKEGEIFHAEDAYTYAKCINGIICYGTKKNNIKLPMGLTKDMINNWRWTKIQEPVNFMTALESGKKVKVKHEITSSLQNIDTGSCVDEIVLKYYEDFKNDKYMKINNLLYLLSYILPSKLLKQIIMNGEWYILD